MANTIIGPTPSLPQPGQALGAGSIVATPSTAMQQLLQQQQYQQLAQQQMAQQCMQTPQALVTTDTGFRNMVRDYGVPKAEVEGRPHRVVYYVEPDRGSLLNTPPRVKEAYFPTGVGSAIRNVIFPRALTYPDPSFDTRDEAENYVRNVLRETVRRSISAAFDDLSRAVFECGLTDDPETTLMGHLRDYLQSVQP